MVCQNCFHETPANYCGNCGQKSGDNKYTMNGMITDLFLSAFHVEKKGLTHTIKELTLRPGHAIRKVVQGQRLFLYPPFKFLVLMGAIVIGLSVRYKFFHNEYAQAGNDGFLNTFLLDHHFKYLENFLRFAEDKATLLNIVTIPVFAFVSWSLISHKRYNFAENLIINTFITAQQLFFLILLTPFIELFPAAKVGIIFFYSIATVVYNIWVYVQLFDGAKIWLSARAGIAVAIAFLYQVPINLLIYFAYDEYFHHHLHWVPEIVIQ